MTQVPKQFLFLRIEDSILGTCTRISNKRPVFIAVDRGVNAAAKRSAQQVVVDSRKLMNIFERPLVSVCYSIDVSLPGSCVRPLSDGIDTDAAISAHYELTTDTASVWFPRRPDLRARLDGGPR